MADLLLERVGKSFDPPRRSPDATAVWAVRDLSLAIRDGEFLTLLGPSGCGKTTTLRMIAGFVSPTTGRIVLGGRVLSSAEERIVVPPERRGMGMVFQSYAVWPHLTAAQNVVYPLRRGGFGRAEMERRTRDALGLVHLDGMDARYPHELSGGQQQRVALARALVMEPAVLLLDEPLSNLDAQLREELRTELRDLHARLRITIVYVTHDQSEAMALSDRIAVVLAGRVAQVGSPRDLYERPTDPAVAAFVGAANFLPGEIVAGGSPQARIRLLDGSAAHVLTVAAAVEGGPGRRVLVCIRPEALETAPDGVLRGRVVRATYLGNRLEYVVQVGTLAVRVEGPADRPVRPGDDVRLAVRRAVVYADSTINATSPGERAT
ncbi:MAG TPA: ABC transporter ATP-binding protein [bacterium]|nr:ABC transporter ATP-binding protein [bacterium]